MEYILILLEMYSKMLPIFGLIKFLVFLNFKINLSENRIHKI